jgi:UPF0716 protein FxsA
LIAIFIVVPLAELYVIFAVGDAIGWLPTIAILAADSILGSLLLKSQGRAVWRRFNEQMQAGRAPTREILDGVLVIFGAAFLITPGFLTDVFGLLLLLPPTRAAFRGVVARRLSRRAVVAMGRRGPRTDWDVEGSATERGEPAEFELPPRTGGRRVGRRP